MGFPLAVFRNCRSFSVSPYLSFLQKSGVWDGFFEILLTRVFFTSNCSYGNGQPSRVGHKELPRRKYLRFNYSILKALKAFQNHVFSTEAKEISGILLTYPRVWAVLSLRVISQKSQAIRQYFFRPNIRRSWATLVVPTFSSIFLNGFCDIYPKYFLELPIFLSIFIAYRSFLWSRRTKSQRLLFSSNKNCLTFLRRGNTIKIGKFLQVYIP